MPISETYNMDCMDYMAGLPDNAFDLCITDPPYNVGRQYLSHDDNMPDYFSWCDEWFGQMQRVSRIVVITVGLVNFDHWYQKRPYAFLPYIKPNQCSPSKLGGFSIWEPIFIFGKPKYRIPQDGLMGMLTVQRDAAFHNCPKQLKDWRKLISWVAREGDSVIDPFLGSGTTRIACYDLGVDFVGIELDKDYFEAQEKWFAEHIKQPSMFEPEKRVETQGTMFGE